jgi:tRNA(Ile2) C34 agmatinyltransferase TiaS
VIYVGIDDTDTCDTRGTNQLAKAISRALAGRFACQRIVRHQLLKDPRVPCTTKNGSASMVFEDPAERAPELAACLRVLIQDDFVPGSDPGLCVATEVAAEILQFAEQCQKRLVRQHQARQLAAAHAITLEGLGGTEDGVIGALAAVGFAAADHGGRVVQWRQWPDDLSGPQPVDLLRQREVQVRCLETQFAVNSGVVDVGKHLRPNWQAGRCVLFAVAEETQGTARDRWKAVRLP